MQLKGEPGLQKGKKRGTSRLRGRKKGSPSKKTRQKISDAKIGKSINFSKEELELER